MQINIGTDIVEIKRFESWHKYPQNKLLRIFSLSEIEYCLKEPLNSAQRFAVRFAAREALYKALTPFKIENFTFLNLCKNIKIEIDKFGAPSIKLSNSLISKLSCDLNFSISLSHTSNNALATVIAYSIDKIE